MRTVLISLIFTLFLFVELCLNAANNPPVAVNDSYSIQKNLTLIASKPGLLANDSDLDNDPITAIQTTLPEHGNLTINADGSFSYTPVKDFVGNDFFTYKASDGNLESTPATVSIIVTPPPNTPPAAVDDIYSMEQNVTIVVSAPGILANDSDNEGKTLSAEINTRPLYGILNLASDGSFKYTPKTNFSGKDSFSYKAFDGELKSETATVTIQVNPPNLVPEAVNDLYFVRQGKSLTLKPPGLLENDKVMTGKTLTTQNDTSPQHGNLTLNTDGSFSYTPNPDFSGKDYFKYKVTDGKITSSPGFVIIKVLPPLPTKIITKEDSYAMQKNKSLIIPAPGLIQNDSIPENWSNEDITLKLKISPQHGTANIQPNGSFLYIPQKNFTGNDYIYYKLILSAGSETIRSKDTKITVTVTADTKKIIPIPIDDFYTTEMNTVLKIPTAAGLLLNDTILSQQNVSVKLADSTIQGTVKLNPDGSFEYAPPNGTLENDGFSYFIKYDNDKKETLPVFVHINILPTKAFNSIPVAVDDCFSTPPNSKLEISPPGLTANDFDADNDPLYASITKKPLNGEIILEKNGSFTYTPKHLFSGKDTFYYSLSDTKNNSEKDAKVIIMVTPEAAANHPPVAIDDFYEINEDLILNMGYLGPLANDTDPDGHSITFFLTTLPKHGSFQFDKKLSAYTYTPNWGFTGVDSFTYVAKDNFSQSNKATVNITVHNANTNLPPIVLNDLFAVSENQTLYIPAPGVMANDFDPNRYNTISASKITDTKHGSLIFNSNGSFVYKPNNGFSGSDSFSYSISDGSLNSNKANVTILVQNNILSIGSVVTIKASDLNDLDQLFLSRVKVSAHIFHDKTATLKLVESPENSTTTSAVWTKKIRLYDKKAIKREGYPQWLKNNIQEPAQCNLKIKYLNKNGNICSDSAGTYLLVPPLFDFFSFNGHKTSTIPTDSEFTVYGRFFGSKKPKISILSIASGKMKKLKIIKPLTYSDYKSNPGKSCMNVKTGDSNIKIYISRKITPGKYYFILDNKIGLAVDPIHHELPIIEIR